MKILSILMVFLLAACFTISLDKEVFAKCEKALERLKAAEAELNAANAAYDAAAQKAKQAAANLAAAVANLNAVAANLGVQGRATAESATFGRSPTNPAFFDDPGYKAAKQAWQDAKAANAQAQGELAQAGARRQKARDEYDAAKKEYDRLRREHLMEERGAGDEGLLLPPEPLKLDEKLSEEIGKIIKDETLDYQIEQADTLSDINIDLKRTAGKTLINVSVVSKGKGAQAKKWVPIEMSLMLDKKPFKPIKTNALTLTTAKHPAPRSASSAMPGLLTSVGTSYLGSQTKTASHAGDACPTDTTGGSTKGGYKSNLIGGAGIAAGMGLLATRAATDKSTIQGLKGTFDVTGYEAGLANASLKAAIQNKDTHRIVYINTPINFDWIREWLERMKPKGKEGEVEEDWEMPKGGSPPTPPPQNNDFGVELGGTSTRGLKELLDSYKRQAAAMRRLAAERRKEAEEKRKEAERKRKKAAEWRKKANEYPEPSVLEILEKGHEAYPRVITDMRMLASDLEESAKGDERDAERLEQEAKDADNRAQAAEREAQNCAAELARR